jgi:hypothetical protein
MVVVMLVLQAIHLIMVMVVILVPITVMKLT